MHPSNQLLLRAMAQISEKEKHVNSSLHFLLTFVIHLVWPCTTFTDAKTEQSQITACLNAFSCVPDIRVKVVVAICPILTVLPVSIQKCFPAGAFFVYLSPNVLKRRFQRIKASRDSSIFRLWPQSPWHFCFLVGSFSLHFAKSIANCKPFFQITIRLNTVESVSISFPPSSWSSSLSL